MKCPQKIDYEQSSILIEIAHSLFLYRFFDTCKTASSSCKKQYKIGLKIVDILINSYDFCETVRKKRKAYWQS